MKNMMLTTRAKKILRSLGFAALAAVMAPAMSMAQATNLTLIFSSPATNASPGATFQGEFNFSPVGSVITAIVTSGTAIVPQANITFSISSGTNGTVFLEPLTNMSGSVNAQIRQVSGNQTNIQPFTVVFRPYPPSISVIGNRTIPEDGSTNVPFIVTDPDTPLNNLVFTTNSSNTALLDNSNMSISGTGSNRFILLTPKPDINGTSVVTMTVSDGIFTNSRSFNLIVTSVPDPSTVTGIANRAFGDNVGVTNIFAGIGINDVDHLMQLSEQLVATATLANDQIATFANGSITYARTGTPSQVTAQIAALGLQPLPFRGVPGTINNVAASVRVRGVADNITVTNNISLSIEVINTPPSFYVSLSPTSVVEGATIQPFFIDFIYDPDTGDEEFTFTIELINTNQSNLITIGPTNSLSDNEAGLQSGVRNINVTASAGLITNAVVNIPFRFLMTDGHGGTFAETNVLTLLQAQNPPQISGIPVQTINKTDADPAFIIYPTAFIQDPDQGGLQNVRATISQSNPMLGTFSVTSFPFMTPLQLSTSLQGVAYTPIAGALPVGSMAESVVLVTAIDTSGQSAQNNSLKIHITSVNNAPQILNVPAPADQPKLIPPAEPLLPFAELGLSNDDTNVVLYTVSIDNINKGSLTNLGSFTQSPPGVFKMTGSITSILSSLTNIIYKLNPSYLFPSDDPGGTTFTLSARDYALLTTTKTLAIQVQEEPRNHLVVRTLNDGLPGSLTYALVNAGNNDVITFALPSYPATVRMPGSIPSTLIRNISIKGPGANLLTISGDNNGDNIPNRQLFRIRSRVSIEGVTLSRGTASFGGAILVESNGFLTLRRCAVVDSVASQYGGAIDVDGGQLTIDSCFIARNSLSQDTGMSGAGVSVYSDKEIQILNTTFAGNIQPNSSGDGGGALVVQNRTVSLPLNAYITHCTFIENEDASEIASAALSVDFGTRIRAWNSIFSDFSGRNIDVSGTGEFITHGGNICDDSTRTLNLQQGQSGEVFLLNTNGTDLTLTDPLLAPLNMSGDPTPFSEPLLGSPAIEKGAGSTLGVDQRGILRQGIADSGAVEFNALGRMVINEIHFDDNHVNFIELFVRRDSTPIDLAPYSLFVDGVKVHDFSDSKIIGTNSLFIAGANASTIVNPGFGMVLAFTNNPIQITSSMNPTPVVRPSVTNAVLDLEPRGVVTIGAGGAMLPVARQSYLGVYMSPVTGTNILNTAGNSLTLAPQYLGFSLVPHSFVLAGPFSGVDSSLDPSLNPYSPGAGSDGTPFGQNNAEPLAVPDIFTVNEDDLNSLPVRNNDFDGDGNDRLIIVDVSPESDPGVGDVAATNSQLGAAITVDPDAAPLRGDQITFDPRFNPTLQALPVGVEIIDTFYYEIIDLGSAPVENYSDAGGGTTLVAATNHRLTNGVEITISGADSNQYNGTFAVTAVTEDSFTIPVAFVGANLTNGQWETVLPRSPSSRSEASVSVRVVGANDPPIANLDIITNVTEISLVRLMIRPEQAGTPLSFPGDPIPAPVMLTQDVIFNDDDIDSDDSWSSLRVVGVMGSLNTITNYSGIIGETPVTIGSPAHGLANDTEILIANYGGHSSYNGYHAITVIDADTFTIPVFYVDNDADKGVWVILNDANRYDTITDVDASVSLTLRANPEEDHIIYDASASAFLLGLAEGERHTNRFYYALEDSHGGIGIGSIDVLVDGLNNIPVANPDADSLGLLDPLVNDSNTLDQVLADGLDLMYILPPQSGGTNRTDLFVLDLDGILPGTVVLNDFFVTDEDTSIDIDEAEVLANDTDIDRTDTHTVLSVDLLSREGATVSLSGGVITYDPSIASNLQALAREEMLIDSFSIVITDGFTDGMVTSLVAVLVIGANDSPVANPDELITNEDEIFVFDPRINDTDTDINLVVPDDRLGIVPVSNWPNPGMAQVDMSTTNVRHDATVSDLLNQLADWQLFTNRFNYTITDNNFLFAVDDEFYVPAGSVNRIIDVLANDKDYTDSDGFLTIIDAGPTLQGGIVSISSNGQYLVYSSPVGFIGDDYFRYVIQNDRGDINSGRVLVRSTVASINGLLHAANDHFTIAAGENASLNVLANDNMLPLNGASLIITELVSSSQPGQPVLTNNTFMFAATNGLATLTFTYKVSGGGSSSAEAQATVEVIERRGTLKIQSDHFSVLPGSFENVLDVLVNDGLVTEPTASLRIKEILVPTSHGTITTNDTGTHLIYTPTNGFIGIDQFSYLATDQIGGTGTGLVSIAVGQLNVAADFFKIAASTNLVPVVLNVLGNDRVLPNPRGSLSILSVQPSNATSIGTLQVSGSGLNLEFIPSNSLGQLEFGYVVADGGTPARVATGRVTIATVSPGIYANPDRYIVRGGEANLTLNVLTNDISYPNVNKTYTILSIGVGPNAPNHGGSVSIVGNTLQYTPAPGYFGEETFTYTMSDSIGTDVAQVSVSVIRGDLYANDDEYAVFYEIAPGTNIAKSFSLSVLLNDRILPPLDQIFAISVLGAGTNAPDKGGSVLISPDNQTLIYRPVLATASNYVEHFTYEIADGSDRRAFGAVKVRVYNRASNLVAVTQDDAFTVARNSSNNSLLVLANDYIRPGTAAGWSITAVSPSLYGGVVAISNSVVSYSPPAGFVGIDTFTYNVNDGLGGTGSAEVNVRVGSMPVLPDLFTVMSESVDNELDVLANDIFDSNYVNEYILADVYGITFGGAVAISASNTVLYTPDAFYPGPYPYSASFIYEVSDETGVSATGMAQVIVHKTGSDLSTTGITLIVEGRNDQPVIINNPDVLSITDKESTAPFENVLFIEVDEQLMEKVDVSVSLDDAVKGILRNLGSFVETSPGVYTLTNVTAAQATAQIFGLVFDPTENRITVPTSEITYFTITITDNKSPVVYDTNSFVTVTAANDAPEISGTVAGQVMYQGFPIKLFSSVTITEVDDLGLQPLEVTITLSDASHGYLVNLGVFSAISNGVYRATGVTAADVSLNLRAMSFAVSTNGVPPGTMQTTLFSIDVEDGFAPTVSDDITTVTALSGLEQILTPNVLDTNLLEGVGWAVAMNDNVVVAGAQYAEVNLTTNIFNDGRVVIFERVPNGTNIWTQTYVIPPVTNILDGYFGVAVDIDQETIVVGGEYEPSSPGFRSGRVHVYHRNPTSSVWDLKASIVSPVTNNFARFGATVDLEGDLLAVGAPEAFLNGTVSGGAFIFSRNLGGSNAWGLVKSIIPTGVVNNARFGFDVSLHHETLVVGSPQIGTAPTNRGAVFVYQKNQGGSNQWGFVQRLTTEVAVANTRLGTSVDVEGDFIVAGAPGESSSRGAAYLYKKLPGTNVWMSAQKFVAPIGLTNDQYGTSVTMNEEILIVGAPRIRTLISPTTNRVGVSYVYTLADGATNGWQLANQLRPPTNSVYALFGSSMHVYGRRAVIGAPMNKVLNSESPIRDNGAVYMYFFDVNNPPGVILPIDDQYAEINVEYTFLIPTNTFGDPDFNDSLTMSLEFPAGGGGLSYEPIAPAITGTPVQLGFVPVNLIATDEGGLRATNDFNVIVLDSALLPPSPSTLWLLLNFGDAASTSTSHQALWALDSDGDHTDNEQEYVFGGDPNTPDDNGLTWKIHIQNEKGIITFLRRTNDPDLTYELEGTLNPRSGVWYEVNTSLLSESTLPVGADFELVTLQISLDDDDPWEDYRIKVSY